MRLPDKYRPNRLEFISFPLFNAFMLWLWFLSCTHRDLHTVLPLKLWDVLVPPGHLRAVQWPEATHHLDGALCWVGHPAPVLDGWMDGQMDGRSCSSSHSFTASQWLSEQCSSFKVIKRKVISIGVSALVPLSVVFKVKLRIIKKLF